MTSQKCIYCNDRDATERDHVPPKSLFPKPAPNNLITVPACSICNREMSKDEEYFRAIVSQLVQTEKHPASKWLMEQKILKGLERRPKLASKIMSTVIPVDMTYEGKYIGTAAAFNIDNPSFARVMTKILKGLLYYETGKTVPDNYRVEWDVIHKPLELPGPLYQSLIQTPSKIFGDQVFEYKVYIHPGTIGSFWLLVFYSGAGFHGGIFPNESTRAQMRGSQQNAG